MRKLRQKRKPGMSEIGLTNTETTMINLTFQPMIPIPSPTLSTKIKNLSVKGTGIWIPTVPANTKGPETKSFTLPLPLLIIITKIGSITVTKQKMMENGITFFTKIS